MIQRNRVRTQQLWTTATVVFGLCSGAVHAQSTENATPLEKPSGLVQIFEATWTRQPEFIALQARRDAANAQQRASSAWTPEPPALELSNRTDRLHRNQGARETELGVAMPLWLPGERTQAAALAGAESAAVESHAAAAKLRVAALVREAWWQWQKARIEVQTARSQLDSTRRIAADVALRTRAGDLARADQHQAEGAVASAQVNVAVADTAAAAARQHLRALTGSMPLLDATGIATQEPEPAPVTDSPDLDNNVLLQELKDRATVAERTATLAASRTRANPELVLSVTRDRGAFSEPAQKTITVGVRIPFGGGPRQLARVAGATAEAAEAQAQLSLERERLVAETASARARVDGLRTQLEATEQRAQLARESRNFFDKSFRLGETDLPNRLRIEAEATEAERQSARIRIELSAAVSALRQALGLLPE